MRRLISIFFVVGAIALAGCEQKQQPAYHVGEANAVGSDPASADAGPVRLASFSNVQGDVFTRPTEKGQWMKASCNYPIRQGAQVYCPKGSRAELRMDDGSYVRFGGGALGTFRTMYSDRRGEFTEVAMDRGVGYWHCRNKLSSYQIDLPYNAVRLNGPADCRIGLGNTEEIVCPVGQCEVLNDRETRIINANEYVDLSGPYAPFNVAQVPVYSDTWATYNLDRDRVCDVVDTHIPGNIALVTSDLSPYGTWYTDSTYGSVWHPTVASTWQPYRNGHWEWVSPWGWTWVEDEAWGWAPFHYGTWINEPAYGWSWVPGPAQQYWSPAVVDFATYNNTVAWAPLSPYDVRYPSMNIGFGSNDFWLSFSIGGVGGYYPSNGYFVPNPWANTYANYYTTYYQPDTIAAVYNQGFYPNAAYYQPNAVLIPYYARNGLAVTVSPWDRFAYGPTYYQTPSNGAMFFKEGRSFTAAPRGNVVFGPQPIRSIAPMFRPNPAWTASNVPMAFNQDVYRGNLPATITQRSAFRGQFAQGQSRSMRAGMQQQNGVPGQRFNQAAPRNMNGFNGNAQNMHGNAKQFGRTPQNNNGNKRGFLPLPQRVNQNALAHANANARFNRGQAHPQGNGNGHANANARFNRGAANAHVNAHASGNARMNRGAAHPHVNAHAFAHANGNPHINRGPARPSHRTFSAPPRRMSAPQRRMAPRGGGGQQRIMRGPRGGAGGQVFRQRPQPMRSFQRAQPSFRPQRLFGGGRGGGPAQHSSPRQQGRGQQPHQDRKQGGGGGHGHGGG